MVFAKLVDRADAGKQVKAGVRTKFFHNFDQFLAALKNLTGIPDLR